MVHTRRSSDLPVGVSIVGRTRFYGGSSGTFSGPQRREKRKWRPLPGHTRRWRPDRDRCTRPSQGGSKRLPLNEELDRSDPDDREELPHDRVRSRSRIVPEANVGITYVPVYSVGRIDLAGRTADKSPPDREMIESNRLCPTVLDTLFKRHSGRDEWLSGCWERERPPVELFRWIRTYKRCHRT